MRLTNIVIASCVFAAAPLAAQSAPPFARQVDAVFAQYNRPDVPGCAVGVFQKGKITYSKGYGSANLEYGVPITPKTPFIS